MHSFKTNIEKIKQTSFPIIQKQLFKKTKERLMVISCKDLQHTCIEILNNFYKRKDVRSFFSPMRNNSSKINPFIQVNSVVIVPMIILQDTLTSFDSVKIAQSSLIP